MLEVYRFSFAHFRRTKGLSGDANPLVRARPSTARQRKVGSIWNFMSLLVDHQRKSFQNFRLIRPFVLLKWANENRQTSCLAMQTLSRALIDTRVWHSQTTDFEHGSKLIGIYLRKQLIHEGAVETFINPPAARNIMYFYWLYVGAKRRRFFGFCAEFTYLCYFDRFLLIFC